jgi:hypothetical protein
VDDPYGASPFVARRSLDDGEEILHEGRLMHRSFSSPRARSKPFDAALP